MKKQNIFSSKIRVKILRELERSPKKFVNLKKSLNLESNLLSYNLKILNKEKFINKKEYIFSLTDKGKYIMPYVRKFNDASQIPIPCVATIVTEGDKVLIRKKIKEPTKGRGIFIGGKIEIGEDIFEACRRHVIEKTEVNIKNLKLRCINNFISRKKEEIAHFVVFFVTANVKKGEIPKRALWKNIKNIREKMYPDNKYVLKNFLNSHKINFIQSNYNEDLDKFDIVNIS